MLDFIDNNIDYISLIIGVISLFVGFVSLIYSILGYINSKKAKEEAMNAKIQLGMKSLGALWSGKLNEIKHLSNSSERIRNTRILLNDIKGRKCLPQDLLDRIEVSLEELKREFSIYKEIYLDNAFGTIEACIEYLIYKE